MARKDGSASDKSPWGTAMRPGKTDGSEFNMLVSPLGQDCTEKPAYSPSHTVNGAKQKNEPPLVRTEFRRNEARGG